jgi:hypothetical protein
MRDIPRLLQLSLPVGATLLPIAGYLLLSRFDSSWKLAAGNNRAPLYPFWIVLVIYAPIAALAVVGALRSTAAGLQETILRLWAPGALVTYLALSPSVPFHALEGASVPLAILAVRAFRGRVGFAIAAAALGALAVAGAVHSATQVRDQIHANAQAYVFAPGEWDALRAIDRSPSGGVLAPAHISTAVPAYSGHPVWLGHPSWTPDFFGRGRRAEALFDGHVQGAAAVSFVRSTGARFILSDCLHPTNLAAPLAPLVAGRRQFGCAQLYEIRRQR